MTIKDIRAKYDITAQIFASMEVMNRYILMICAAISLMTISGCGSITGDAESKEIILAEDAESKEIILSEDAESKEIILEEDDVMNKIYVAVGEYEFTATLEDNDATRELLSMLYESPLVLDLEDYSGFEKVGPLGRKLTRSDVQTTTESGDIVLYNGNNIVIFYGSNSWSYTRLGKIDDLTNWEKALGSGNVSVTLSLDH